MNYLNIFLVEGKAKRKANVGLDINSGITNLGIKKFDTKSLKMKELVLLYGIIFAFLKNIVSALLKNRVSTLLLSLLSLIESANFYVADFYIRQ